MNNYKIFTKWCNDNGAILSDLTLETYRNNERGIHSIKGVGKVKH